MSKGRILIINDDPDIIKAISPILRARNYVVNTASGGEEGLERAKIDHPNLIILETELPDISGYDACTRLKADRTTRNIPVIMMSANGHSDSVVRARASGASDYIVKPFNLFTLLGKLRRFLED
jgi:two-component system phosphate regulon response regulator PhoB